MSILEPEIIERESVFVMDGKLYGKGKNSGLMPLMFSEVNGVVCKGGIPVTVWGDGQISFIKISVKYNMNDVMRINAR